MTIIEQKTFRVTCEEYLCGATKVVTVDADWPDPRTRAIVEAGWSDRYGSIVCPEHRRC